MLLVYANVFHCAYKELKSYFSQDAMCYINALEVKHLLVDLPSVDRENDGGRLAAHRIFWNLPVDVALSFNELR